MSQETSQILDRLHRVLVEEIRASHPELLERSFTVAEIYQKLVPYRSHRDRIGVEMNADYEHALLELLAGEGEYLTLESRAAHRQICEELESLNPDTSIYRDFAAVEVRLNPETLPESVGDEGPGAAPGAGAPDTAVADDAGDGPAVEKDFFSEGGAASPPPDEEEDAPSGETAFAFVKNTGTEAEASVEAGAAETGAPEAETAVPPGGEGSPERSDDDACRWCRGALPERDDLRFCPHCGSPVDRVPCPECGAELDPEWRFCVACGTDVGDEG